MQKAAEGFTTNRKPVPPVAFRELIDFLPKKMAGMKADEPKGETTTAGSWQYSQAEVDFRTEDGKRTRTSESSTTPTSRCSTSPSPWF